MQVSLGFSKNRGQEVRFLATFACGLKSTRVFGKKQRSLPISYALPGDIDSCPAGQSQTCHGQAFSAGYL
jgi:hypothetical protein